MPLPTRREVLAAAAAAATPVAFAARAAERVPVVDTHVHCFAGQKDPTFPYHEDAPYTPGAAPPEFLLECMAGAGVDFAVVVHPEPYQDDHRYLEPCLTVGKGKLKGTCLFFAGRDGNAEKLAALARAVPLVAGRIHAYVETRLPPFGRPELRELWKQYADAGLAVQLHFEPKWAEGFEALIREFKHTPVLIDHMGRPFQGTAKQWERVVGWSRYPNVVVKLSAVPDRGAYPHRDPQPEVRVLTEAFGADRLMYGGGFGEKATGAGYRAERERIAALLAHLSGADRAKVLGGTAAKLFALG